MTISVIVHGEVAQDEEDEDFVDDGSVVLQTEFTTNRLVHRLSDLIKRLERNKVEELSIFTEDHFVGLLDHGGDLESDDVNALAEDFEIVVEHFPELEFKTEEDHHAVEIFIDEFREILRVCEETEGYLEFFNNEESVKNETELEDEPEDDTEDEDENAEDYEEVEDDEEVTDSERGEAESFIKNILGGAFKALEDDSPNTD